MTRGAMAALLGLWALTSQQPRIFRSSAEAVRVDVLVTDGKRPIAGLTAGDFEVRDSGVPQSIADVQIAEIPFSLSLVLDTSSSVTGPPLREIQAAAQAALDTLHPDDRASLIAFGEEIRRLASWDASRFDLKAAVSGLRAGGTTSLFDAATTALVLRDPEPGRRNLVVIFTDGYDTASWLPKEAPLDLAQRTDAVVESVVVPAPLSGAGPEVLFRRSGIRLTPDQPVLSRQDFMEEIAHRTGGDLITTHAGDLAPTFEHIVSEFRSRYVLTYVPQHVDKPGWHPIVVKVKGRRATVQARRGYERVAAPPDTSRGPSLR